MKKQFLLLLLCLFSLLGGGKKQSQRLVRAAKQHFGRLMTKER